MNEAPARRLAPIPLSFILLTLLQLPQLLAAPAAGAESGPALGRLEQESLEDAMTALGLTLDRHPAGKTVGTIHVVNQEVFSRRDWLFQLLNIFHRTTRPHILQRELLIKSGQPYDQLLVEESIRYLQSGPSGVSTRSTFSAPELSSVVVLVPIVSSRPGTVDLLAVTRDVWSLRFNTNFEFQQDTLSYLSTSLSENNLLGWRKFLSVGFEMDQGKAAIGPTYFDPNIAGTRLTLFALATAHYARDDRRYEGNTEQLSLRYPLYALASRWGGGVDVSHQDAVVRSFRGNQLRTRDLIATPDTVEALPHSFRHRILAVDVSAIRSFGVNVVQRVILGHRIDSRRSQVLPGFLGDPANPLLPQQFLSEIAPLSETRSEPYLRYELFTARYLVVRNLNTFDLRENQRLGPYLSLEIALGAPAWGADFTALPVSGAAGWSAGPGGGYLSFGVHASARLRGDRFIDQNAGADIFMASPVLGGVLRLVVNGAAEAVRANSRRFRYYLGGATGLRGYAIGDFEGSSQVVAHAELRTMPLEVFSQRLGTLLFYDVGHAASSFATIVPHHDFGLGLRWLIPQLNSSVLRFDWALATQDTALTRAGFPGRFTAGFLQVF